MRRTASIGLCLCVLLLIAGTAPAAGLYTFVGGGKASALASVDPASGQVSFIGLTNVGTAPGLDFPPGDVSLYGIRNGWVKTFDITSGLGTRLKAVAPDMPEAYQSLAFNPITGELYGIDSVTDALHRIDLDWDPDWAVIEVIGSLGTDIDVGMSGMDFAPDGTLYLLVGQGGAGDRHRLFTVDVETGAAQLVGRIGFPFAMCDLAVTADGTLYASGHRFDDPAPHGDGPYLFKITPVADSSGVLQTEIVGLMAVRDGEGNVIDYGDATALAWGPIAVTIDIKPNEWPNTINIGSQGLIPVAIYSSSTFDATKVDADTVSLAGAEVALRGRGNNLMAHEEDVNQDGLLDLVVHIVTEHLDQGLASGSVSLTGKLFGSEESVDFVGYDDIVIVPPGQ